MRTRTIHVTVDDINQGFSSNARHCPIALAIQRETGDKTVAVGRWSLFRYAEGGRAEQKLPPEAIDFIEAFDDGLKVKPISFTILD